MLEIEEVIVVEGRYDKNTLSQVVRATILETAGFGIFSDKEKVKLLRLLARERGIIVFTDGDGAGFVIRNYLKGALPQEQVKHAYIPDVYGKERRKQKAGREGKLGVEGMSPQVIEAALRSAGATFREEGSVPAPQARRPITKTDFYQTGLSGAPDSGEKRRALARRLDLPEHLNANGLLEVCNVLYSYEEFLTAVQEL